MSLQKFFLQSYDCSSNDAKNLDRLQEQIQNRIDFLNENNMNSFNDPLLLELYDKHSQIQECLFYDHTDQYLLIIGIISAVSFFIYFRWRMIKHGKTSKNRFNFKG
ncbi:MAG: hypothetical protein R3327_03575 [Nitrosopumilaceae archaeon]|nr:hypothetical protein [Nitrosopumilaceae archaeon]